MQDEMTNVARQHYKYPITCTIAVFEVMQRAVENPRYCNSYVGDPVITLMMPNED